MGLINQSDAKAEAPVMEDNEPVVRRVNVRESLSNDTQEIIELLTVMLTHLNLDYIRLEKGVIEYTHYPDYRRDK